MDKSPSLQGETSHHCPDVESGASDQTSVVELVSQWTETDPNQFAIHHNASSWSYRELAHTFKRCAAQLKEIRGTQNSWLQNLLCREVAPRSDRGILARESGVRR
jgi:hypothetical protein